MGYTAQWWELLESYKIAFLELFPYILMVKIRFGWLLKSVGDLMSFVVRYVKDCLVALLFYLLGAYLVRVASEYRKIHAALVW